MRILKKTQQRNCGIATEFYTESDLRILQEKDPAVFSLMGVLHNPRYLRVDLTMCKTISVIYDRSYELYVNVVVTESGNRIYVDL